MNNKVLQVFILLAQSRKFWLALLAFIAAVVLYAQGSITAEQLTDAILALAGTVIAAIAIEDAAAKWSSGNPDQR